jgi:hypothetical protein
MHGQGLSTTSPPGLPFPLPFFAKIRVHRALDLIAAPSNIPYFQYPGLSACGKTDHKVFTRQGGRSLPPYDSFNTSLAVDDRPENVTYHLEQIRSLLGAESLAFMNQTHGDRVAAVGRDTAGDPVPDADAIITGDPGVAIMVKQADCQGVMLLDPVKWVVANVHCGWRGNVQNILGKTVGEMVQSFGCRAEDVRAAISPSLGPCCAQYRTYDEIFPESFLQFRVGDDHFDLRAVSCWQLVEAGVLPENIEVADVCTSCRTDLFYSYRREGETGRFASVVMVKR